MSEQHPHLPRATGHDDGGDKEKVYDAEVIHEEYHYDTTATAGERRNGGGSGFRMASWNWTSTGGLGAFDAASRYVPAVTAILAIVVLFRFGFLACLGFLFFYAVGAAVGTVRLIRRMAEGKSLNPWLWRIGNWAVAFLLAGWLSGGFR